jgi:hypothetical protein
MGGIMSYLRTVCICNQIIYRHTHIGQRNGLQSRLEDTIVDTLSLNLSDPKLYVYWGGYMSGKSRAATNAAIRLQEKGKLAMLNHGWDFTNKSKIRDWLRMSIGIPEDRAGEKLSSFLHTKRAVLILDHPDFLLKQHGESGLVEGLRKLEIPVLILVNSWERAVELKKCGCELLGEPGFGRWREGELAELFTTFSPVIRDKTQALKSELHQCAVLAGAPGILFHECHFGEKCIEPDMHRARLMQKEWQNGMRALQGQDLGDIKGRFPDKDGIFHWDPLPYA